MSEATATKVNKSELRGIYVALGSEAAAEWSDKRLLSKIETLGEMSKNEEAMDNLNKAQKKILKSILGAQKEEAEFELVDDESKPKVEEKPAAKKKVVADDDEDTKPAPKVEEEAKVKRGAPKSAGGEGKPGIIASIKEFLGAASESKPLTKAAIVKKLEARFPDRDGDAMAKTVAVQCPNRLKKDGFEIEDKQTEEGKAYWIEVMPAGKAKAKAEAKAGETATTKKKAAVPEDDDE